ncbi:MAG: hypothetical protein AAGK79_13235 [Pseudomonadota bacterium]
MKFSTWTVRNTEDWERFAHWFSAHPNPYPFRINPGDGRSLSQNALFHLWVGQIASQRGDVSASTVKGELHHRFGLGIRLRDPQFTFIWDKIGASDWPYDKQCNLLSSGALNVSSAMTTAELKEYLNEIELLAAQQGWHLTHPREQSND